MLERHTVARLLGLVWLLVMGHIVTYGTSSGKTSVNPLKKTTSGLHDPLDSFCKPHDPCVYPETVKLRVIILTYHRPRALQTLLAHVTALELDGDLAALEIFIDRSKETGEYDQNTFKVAQEFDWSGGRTRVHVWGDHVGLYGQWVDSWRPEVGSQEIALVLEDDVVVSRFAWRWLRAVHQHYGHMTNLQGYTLQSEEVYNAKLTGWQRRLMPLKVSGAEPTFLYRVVGSWGFSPHPVWWPLFQDWFHAARRNQSFHPYVWHTAHKLEMTKLYKNFEIRGMEDSMWTMWYVYFTHEHNLLCVYNNLPRVLDSAQACLAVHRAEPGLHFQGKPNNNQANLLHQWKEEFVEFSNTTPVIGYDGTYIRVL